MDNYYEIKEILKKLISWDGGNKLIKFIFFNINFILQTKFI